VLAEEGYDLIFGVGFMFSDVLGAVAKDFPDTHFGLIDGYVADLTPDSNITVLSFDEHVGSFLIGAVATTLAEGEKVGFLGGMERPPRDESSDNYRPITLDRIARLFPNNALIAAHMGTLHWFHEILAVTRHACVYADTSASAVGVDPAFYQLPLHNTFRWEKALFGTDSLPDDGHVPVERLTRLMDALAIPAATRAKIWGGTAARLFRVQDAPA